MEQTGLAVQADAFGALRTGSPPPRAKACSITPATKTCRYHPGSKDRFLGTPVAGNPVSVGPRLWGIDTSDKPTPKEQIVFLLFLSGAGQLHAFEDSSDFGARIGDFALIGGVEIALVLVWGSAELPDE